MNGPVFMMAPAIETVNLPFHRSHSTPDLLLSGGLTDQDHLNHHTGTTTARDRANTLDQRTLSLKRLPSLPAFDVPSLNFEFDFDSDFDSLRFESGVKVDKPRPKTSTNEKNVVEIRTSTTTAAPAVPARKEKTSRRKSMIDRNRSWLPSSKSSTDVRATARLVEDSGATLKTKAKVNGAVVSKGTAAAETEVPPVPPLPTTKPIGRSKTEISLAGLAKRSWMSSSRSPSPLPKKESKTPARQRTDSNGGISKKIKAKFEAGPVPGSHAESGRGSGPAGDHLEAPGSGLLSRPEGTQARSSSSESLSSTGRALNRASSYLTKFKRPQSVFVKSASSLSLSASASSPNVLSSSKAATEDTDNTNTALPALRSVSSTSSFSSTVTLIPDHPTTTEAKTDSLDIDNSNTVANHRNSSHTTSSDNTDSTAAASENASSQATTDTAITMPHPTSRDPLWAIFKNLDAEYAKFVTKNQTSAKMGAVRSTLLPFLHSTAGHESNSNRSLLTPEDVDRRAVILNKWWNGLLEMLDAAQQSAFGAQSAYGSHVNSNMGFNSTQATIQPVAGVDRPTLLEATTMIMMRPEWRLSTSYFQPLAERSPGERVRARSGSQSSTGTGDWGARGGIIVETAEHNIRTMFVTNLTTQMAIVVDKMSMRHAPTSLVNWSGKACAYAFFFCPGVADVLVRLWALRPDLVRRTADAFGLPRRSKGESEDLVALFPPNLGGLGWTSVKTITDKMRVAAKLPLLQAKIPWHSPWLSRWRGADTDLFFIFAKYYHIMAEEFMPHDLPLIEQARAPAFVLLHAQLLANLDSTIHRMAAIDQMFGPPLTDQAHGSDASMSAMPLQPSNVFMGMGENRLVVLLKDMLGDNTVGVLSNVKTTFAEAFMCIMKAATKATARYEHTSIHMLCDFLEEALTTYHIFQNGLNNGYATSEGAFSFGFPPLENHKQIDLIDWPFWFDVSEKILSSNNTMAEIRLLSFIYTIWDIIIVDPARKRSLCIDWLLAPATFEYCFNNWCPMIRAYYMRLLCWRICRDSGSANEVDEEIFLLVAARLKTVWAHYLYLKGAAEESGHIPHSTAPCPPTPGKRFMIIRTEMQTPAPGLFVGFDQFPTFTAHHSHPIYGPSPSGTISGALSDAMGSKVGSDSPKKKSSMLSKVLSWTAVGAVGVNQTPFRRNNSETDLERLRAETAASRSRTATPPPPPKPPTTADSTSSTGSALLLDEIQYQFRFTLTWANQATLAALSQNRTLARPRLPAPAQARVTARSMGTVEVAGCGAGYIDSMDLDLEEETARAGLPAAERRVSGASDQGGLISEARNAQPLEADGPSSRSRGLSFTNRSRGESTSSAASVDDNPSTPTIKLIASQANDIPQPQNQKMAPKMGIQPVRPVGIYAANKTYIGRALAEWGIVVNECNSFVDRRRDEGVFGLGDVEVPMLGVEQLGPGRRA